MNDENTSETVNIATLVEGILRRGLIAEGMLFLAGLELVTGVGAIKEAGSALVYYSALFGSINAPLWINSYLAKKSYEQKSPSDTSVKTPYIHYEPLALYDADDEGFNTDGSPVGDFDSDDLHL